ncbi:hypothetical protein BGAL_0102g00030 [Botrytis galanthina]|uniref:Uncharacterized protein n=1 Tax=Botrytis galanthina TaxID=278940 RepID=A0A4S8R1L3_9HELO|nr:hypothetical protein BGAL_0102g00030 [Botrytis galanthina]
MFPYYAAKPLMIYAVTATSLPVNFQGRGVLRRTAQIEWKNPKQIGSKILGVAATMISQHISH